MLHADKVKSGILRIVLGIVFCSVIAIINFVKDISLGVQVLNMSDKKYASKKGTLSSGIPS